MSSCGQIPTTLDSQIELSRLRFRAARRFAHNGGVWTITRELLVYVYGEIKRRQVTLHPRVSGVENYTLPVSAVLLDDREIPVLVEDLEKFLTEITARYHEALNEFFQDYQRLSQARTTEEVVDDSGRSANSA